MAYSYYTNDTCSTAKVAVNTVTVPASGIVPNSSAATFNSAGTYYWQAVYSGDANNNGTSSPCTVSGNEQLTVHKAITLVQQNSIAPAAAVKSVTPTLTCRVSPRVTRSSSQSPMRATTATLSRP